MKRLLGGAGAAIGVKILTGIAVAAAATTFAVAATEVAITGSANPTNWGSQVVTVVNACKASAERTGVHGIGQCVSSFARTHGDTVSDGHPNKGHSDKKGNDNGSDNSNAHSNGNANGTNTTHGNSSKHSSTAPAETSSLIQLVF